MSSAPTTVRIPAPRPWTRYAACRTTDPDLFFPDLAGGRGITAADDIQTQRAKRICRTCPVLLTCLTTATRDREHGVWGGTVDTEREQLRAWDQRVSEARLERLAGEGAA